MKLKIEPSNVYLVKGDYANTLNFDFLIANSGEYSIRLNKLSARFLDQYGKLILYKYLDRNAMLPSIDTLEQTIIPPQKSVCIFNPFHTLNPDIHFDRIQYEIAGENEFGKSYNLECKISPTTYSQKTVLNLPMMDKLLVYDGCEYHAHHRRVDLTHPMLQMSGFNANYVRYAVDLCVIDENDRIFLNQGKQKEDWHSLGANVYAPAHGKVVFAQNDIPENILGEPYAFEHLTDASNYFRFSLGNSVIIDHGHHEYSICAHLMRGSVLPKSGDVVERGQEIARVGFSGDTGSFVHLHYMLTNNYELGCAQALPIIFTHFNKIRGYQTKKIVSGIIETGEIIQHTR